MFVWLSKWFLWSFPVIEKNIFVYDIFVVVCVKAGKFKERHIGISLTLWTARKLSVNFEGNGDALFEGPRQLCWDLCIWFNLPLEKKTKSEHWENWILNEYDDATDAIKEWL